MLIDIIANCSILQIQIKNPRKYNDKYKNKLILKKDFIFLFLTICLLLLEDSKIVLFQIFISNLNFKINIILI